MLKTDKCLFLPIMWRKSIFLLFTVLAMLVPLVSADLQVESTQDARFDCDTGITEDKTFIARTALIHVGLWCSQTANVLIYTCDNALCETKTYQTFASKIDDSLATITGFEVGTKYNYECYECLVAPTLTIEYGSLTIEEGERFELTATCKDNKGRIGSLDFDGWMISSLKLTGYEDAGVHAVTVTCADQNGQIATEELVITVEDVNRPPTVHAVLRE